MKNTNKYFQKSIGKTFLNFKSNSCPSCSDIFPVRSKTRIVSSYLETDREKLIRCYGKDYRKYFGKQHELHPLKMFYRTFSTQTQSLATEILSQRIKSTGPITLASYMKQCLINPDFGYYTTRDPLGLKGDFTTSPEISQMFGELIGLWIYIQWLGQNEEALTKFRNSNSTNLCDLKLKGSCIVELGPGRGTLMQDLLRTLSVVMPNTFKSKSSQNTSSDETQNKPLGGKIDTIYLVEASPILRQKQWNTLCSPAPLEKNSDDSFFSYTSPKIYSPSTKVIWVNSIDAIPKNPQIAPYIIAHEFFDALPIHSFEKTKDGWSELMVNYGSKNDLDPGKVIYNSKGECVSGGEKKEFYLTMPKKSDLNYSNLIPYLNSHSHFNKIKEVGTRIEICPDAWSIIGELGKWITKVNSGGVLIIDYGSKSSIPMNTFRGISKHKLVSPFENPGQCDLTADVDFGTFKEVIKESFGDKICFDGPVEQADFLYELGIAERKDNLVNSASSTESKNRITQSYLRLVDRGNNGMGKLYKFMSFFPSSNPFTDIGFGSRD